MIPEGVRKKKIDCHTHIVDRETKEAYFGRTTGYALVMEMPESLMPNPDTIETVKGDDRLFLNAVVDLKKPIAPRLREIEAHLNDWKVVGLKIYLTYQRGKASDRKMYPIYRFAKKHGLTVTFHTGLTSLVLPSDDDMEGSNAKYIAVAAEKFPKVNFVIAHLDDPRFRECVRILKKHENLFSDVSGAYETGTKEGNDVKGAIRIFKEAILSEPGMEKKILYGTDFSPALNMAQLNEYDETMEAIFQEKDYPDVYYKNCLRAFPKLREYLSIDK